MTETETQTGKRNRLVGDPRTQLGIDLKTRYEQGATISGLAQVTGYSYGFIRDLLTQADATLRRPGNPRRRTPPR